MDDIQKKGCLSVSQRYNLKANHNEAAQVAAREQGVYQ